MRLKAIQFFALLFTALALVPTAAQVLELLNKIDLPRDDYFTVQDIYRGWAFLGIVVFAALLSNFALVVAVRKRRRAFVLAIIALLCIVGTQAVFWTWTYPANAQTVNWMEVPDNWEQLRTHWEYSHAASAVLNLIAFVSVSLSALVTVAPTRERLDHFIEHHLSSRNEGNPNHVIAN